MSVNTSESLRPAPQTLHTFCLRTKIHDLYLPAIIIALIEAEVAGGHLHIQPEAGLRKEKVQVVGGKSGVVSEPFITHNVPLPHLRRTNVANLDRPLLPPDNINASVAPVLLRSLLAPIISSLGLAGAVELDHHENHPRPKSRQIVSQNQRSGSSRIIVANLRPETRIIHVTGREHEDLLRQVVTLNRRISVIPGDRTISHRDKRDVEGILAHRRLLAGKGLNRRVVHSLWQMRRVRIILLARESQLARRPQIRILDERGRGVEGVSGVARTRRTKPQRCTTEVPTTRAMLGTPRPTTTATTIHSPRMARMLARLRTATLRNNHRTHINSLNPAFHTTNHNPANSTAAHPTIRLTLHDLRNEVALLSEVVEVTSQIYHGRQAIPQRVVLHLMQQSRSRTARHLRIPNHTLRPS